MASCLESKVLHSYTSPVKGKHSGITNMATSKIIGKKADRKITLRLYLKPDVFLGPGKADVLRGIRDTGSISATGRLTGMSYKRTWQLVDRMNHDFREQLIQTNTGGASGGGASLTAAGVKVLTLYESIIGNTMDVIAKDMRQLNQMLNDI
jgi:molybdate transport system regulatory protein